MKQELEYLIKVCSESGLVGIHEGVQRDGSFQASSASNIQSTILHTGQAHT